MPATAREVMPRPLCYSLWFAVTVTPPRQRAAIDFVLEMIKGDDLLTDERIQGIT